MDKVYLKELKNSVAVGMFNTATMGLGFEMDVVPIPYVYDIVFTHYNSI